jgi:hypothetical protein
MDNYMNTRKVFAIKLYNKFRYEDRQFLSWVQKLDGFVKYNLDTQELIFATRYHALKSRDILQKRGFKCSNNIIVHKFIFNNYYKRE